VPHAFRELDPVAGTYPAGRPARVGTVPALKARPAVRRPQAATVDVAVPASGTARAGALPVTVSRAAPAGGAGAAPPAKVRVAVLDDAAAARAGVSGPLVRLVRADGVDADGAVSVTVDYAGVAQAYGGGWADRLSPVLLPECALTRPGAKECAPTPLPGRHDRAAGAFTADLTLRATASPQAAAAAPAGALLALTAGPSGSGGDFSATDLAPSATWSAGGSSGDLGWSYGMRVPPAPNGPEPQLGLAYSAGSLDGRTSASNSQPSWAGDGFDLGSGSIVRSYRGCVDDAHPGKGDQCWGGDNATLSLPGHGGELVQDSAGRWRLRNDDGTRIEKLTGAANGDDNG
jgi:hypothetical protein